MLVGQNSIPFFFFFFCQLSRLPKRSLLLFKPQYFGTMAGVRGFGDPNVQINPDGRSTFEQYVHY